jgi:hypothetical protein
VAEAATPRRVGIHTELLALYDVKQPGALRGAGSARRWRGVATAAAWAIERRAEREGDFDGWRDGTSAAADAREWLGQAEAVLLIKADDGRIEEVADCTGVNNGRRFRIGAVEYGFAGLAEVEQVQLAAAVD